MIQAGDILLSQPFMEDPYFKRTAVLVCEHSDDGTVGFILNKPVDTLIDDLIPDFPDFEDTVFYGGPVGADTLHFIHTLGDRLEGALEVVPGVFWGGNYEQLKELISMGLVQPEDINFYIGYSGWSPGQLLDEYSAEHWLSHRASRSLIFEKDHSELWHTILKEKGDTFHIISELSDQLSN